MSCPIVKYTFQNLNITQVPIQFSEEAYFYYCIPANKREEFSVKAS